MIYFTSELIKSINTKMDSDGLINLRKESRYDLVFFR